MKEITKYLSDDGVEHKTANACLSHEALCSEIDEVMSLLPPQPRDDGCRYANGHGYIQHNAADFYRVREALLRIGNRLSPHKWFVKSLEDVTTHPSWCARLIDDTNRPLSRAWYRILCTDPKLREWGQPYYANHPEEAEQIKLN